MNGEGDLKAAEAELALAERELQKIERGIEKAECDVTRAIEEDEQRQRFEVTVLYNGIKKPFEVRREELVKSLLDRAIKEFGPIPNPHTLSLFSEAGVELDDAKTVEAAGVKPHEVLLLRPSTVKGGR
jgi:hypothetical protein